MTTALQRPIVLLAEDSEDDAFFFRWTLKKCGLECDLMHASDGAEAIRMLEAATSPGGQLAQRRPDLVFLDLKMPTRTGFEVLTWIRDHHFQPPLHVSVLSGSEHASDVQRAKDLGAAGYYVKPISAEQLHTCFATWHATARSAAGAQGAASAAPSP